MKMKLVLRSTVLILLLFSRSAVAQSYCPGCEAAIIGVGVGVGVAVGVGLYLMHRSHTSLTGCVQQNDNRLAVTAKNGKNYELLNAPSEVKAHERLLLRGHKVKSTDGQAFRVDRISRDYGPCSP